MKKVIFILVAMMALCSAGAQNLIPSQDSTYEFNVRFDSIQMPDYMLQLDRGPSYYMKTAAEARTAALLGAVGGCLGVCLDEKLFGDSNFGIALGITGGVIAVVTGIISIVYDHKAADAMSKIKVTGNGVTISF